MIVRLYRGDACIGSIDLGKRRPHTIRVTYSLGGQAVRLVEGLEHAMIPPGRVEEVFVRQLVADFDSKQTETRYVLAREAEQFAEPEPRGRKRSP